MKPATPSDKQCQKGNLFYNAFAWFDEETNKAHVEIDTWEVSTVRNAKRDAFDKRFNVAPKLTVFLIRKTEFTWIRKTKGKDQSMCWASSISEYDRKKFRVGQPLPIGIYTTVRQALQYQLERTKEDIKEDEIEISNAINEKHKAEWEKSLLQNTRLLRAIQSRITKLKNKK